MSTQDQYTLLHSRYGDKIVSQQIVPREEETVLESHISELVRKRARDGHLIGRIAGTIFIALAMCFGWTTCTLAIVSDPSWDAAGLIGADGGILLLGFGILLMIWILDE